MARDAATVIAAVRNSSSVASLNAFPKGQGSSLVIVGIDSGIEDSATKAVLSLQSKHKITHVDVVIANAGICEGFSTIAKLSTKVLAKHLDINTYGPLYLFQAVLPLREKSPSPKFEAIGSPIGSMSGMESRPMSRAAYGISTAILHYITRKIHQKHMNITTFAINHGSVYSSF